MPKAPEDFLRRFFGMLWLLCCQPILLSLVHSLFGFPKNGDCQSQRQDIRNGLHTGDAVSTESPGKGVQNGQEAGSLPGSGQGQCALGIAETGTHHNNSNAKELIFI